MARFWTNSSKTLAIRLSRVGNVYVEESGGAFTVCTNFGGDGFVLEKVATMEEVRVILAGLVRALERDAQ